MGPLARKYTLGVKHATTPNRSADVRAATVRILGRDAYDEAVKVAREMVTKGRGEETYVMPSGPTGQPALMSYAVFLNKRGPDSKHGL